MVMKMNNERVLNDLMNKTNKTKEECLNIMSIMQRHSLVGKNSKEKIIKDFQNCLSISYKEADELYNTFAGIIMSGIKEKLKHPFKD